VNGWELRKSSSRVENFDRHRSRNPKHGEFSDKGVLSTPTTLQREAELSEVVRLPEFTAILFPRFLGFTRFEFTVWMSCSWADHISFCREHRSNVMRQARLLFRKLVKRPTNMTSSRTWNRGRNSVSVGQFVQDRESASSRTAFRAVEIPIKDLFG
jgi:hypothetical protein